MNKTAQKRQSGWIAALIWLVSILGTVGSLAYQDRTGPTYPLRGSVATEAGPVQFICMRSQTIGQGLSIVILDPVPDGITGTVRYRRFRSNDDWKAVAMVRGSFAVSGRGRSTNVAGIGAVLPGLNERAGKYEYFVNLTIAPENKPVSITGDRPIYARYKAPVPGASLAAHIAAIFASMLLAIRTTLAALIGRDLRRWLYATIATLLLGGFVLGPLVQWHAFGVWWSGFPFGYDWTDNKVVVELAFWLAALWANSGKRRSRAAVIIAGLATLVVYFIPHSVFGSEYNYITGSGHGTAG